MHQKRGLKITVAVATAAASRWRISTAIMEILLREDTIQITKQAVRAIAWQFNARVVGLLLCRRNLLITSSVMEVLWRKFGSKIESLLIDESTCIQITKAAFLVAVAESKRHGKKLLEKLLLLKSDIKITEKVFIAAVGNRWCGKEIMEVLLLDNDVQTIEAVIQAALGNRPGKELVELLFNRDGIQITAGLGRSRRISMGHWSTIYISYQWNMY